jgi:two-component system sensor histidine kinase KdpD
MMRDRPDPDQLLELIREDEARAARGQLKIFFGACAGVGKTYAMLEAARARQRDGVEVVVGWVETHGRAETEALLEGLEILPPRRLSYRGVSLAEFDLDGALERRPSLILVDELAHTNAPGSRHTRRWQDVVELLDAGIDVSTTLNVQHLESLNDVVAQITGVVVRETVPDRLVEQADEIELVDLPPEDLLKRLREGKVYVAELAGAAAANFFREGNLIALRELALRRTAERVDAQMEHYRRAHAIREPWPAAERLLVLVAPSPYAARLVRATRRMAARVRAPWIAVHVETAESSRLPGADRDQLNGTLALAERLGAEVVTLTGDDVAEEVVALARARNVTRIVIGKPRERGWRERLHGSLPDRLIRASGAIDVHVLSGDPEPVAPSLRSATAAGIGWPGYLWTAAIVTACTLLAAALHGRIADANLIMIYLVGVMVVATRLERRHAVAASVLSVAAFDFFFVKPYLTFAVAETQYLLTFGVMFAAALLLSGLASRIRRQAEAGRTREQRTLALFAMARDLAATTSEPELARAVVRHVAETLDAGVVLVLAGPEGRLEQTAGGGSPPLDEHEVAVARWAFDNRQPAGRWTDTLPGARLLYLPLVASAGAVGVLGVTLHSAPAADQSQLLEAFTNQAALAIERARMTRAAHEAEVQVEAERFRNALLSAVSHDLRTPLASVTGAASALLDPELDRASHDELARTVAEESRRLNRLIGDILQVTRLESGAVTLEKEWQPLEEALGAALSRVEEALGARPVTLEISPEPLLVPADGLLLEQLFYNLLENAAKYTPAGSPITVRAWAEPGWAVVEVADRGPGLPAGTERKAFDTFVRLAAGGRGVGLGLTICRGIVLAHGGTIWAENQPSGGVAFRFRLPIDAEPPRVEPEQAEVGSPPTDAADGDGV